MKYISVSDYLMGRAKIEDLPSNYVANMNTLIPKINELLDRFGEARKCNSGYRTLEDQKRINPHSMQSKHLICAAIDVEDKDRKLANWCKTNVNILEELGFWCEDINSTPTWVHFQIISPKSGKRFFTP